MSPKNIPNLITLSRFVLVFPVLWALYAQRHGLALGLFLIAGISDGVDGLLARRYGWRSRFGSIADPLADKFLLLSCFAMLAWLHVIPLWLVAIVFIRDILIITAGVYDYVRGRRYEYTATFISKTNTVLQIAFVFFWLLELALVTVPNWLLLLTMYAMLITTLGSLYNYFQMWRKQAFKPATGLGA